MTTHDTPASVTFLRKQQDAIALATVKIAGAAPQLGVSPSDTAQAAGIRPPPRALRDGRRTLERRASCRGGLCCDWDKHYPSKLSIT